MAKCILNREEFVKFADAQQQALHDALMPFMQAGVVVNIIHHPPSDGVGNYYLAELRPADAPQEDPPAKPYQILFGIPLFKKDLEGDS